MKHVIKKEVSLTDIILYLSFTIYPSGGVQIEITDSNQTTYTKKYLGEKGDELINVCPIHFIRKNYQIIQLGPQFFYEIKYNPISVVFPYQVEDEQGKEIRVKLEWCRTIKGEDLVIIRDSNYNVFQNHLTKYECYMDITNFMKMPTLEEYIELSREGKISLTYTDTYCFDPPIYELQVTDRKDINVILLQDEGKIETPEYCKRKIEEYQEKFDKLTILFP